MIQDLLADNLALGAVQAVGAWENDDLVGLVVWAVQDETLWRSNVLAVSPRHQRRGIGRMLKEEVIRRAREAGVERIISTVFWENGPMLFLNQALGADIEPDPEQPWDYKLCTISLI
jgi:GNAT superfamily N-acetyltransferase